LALNLLAATRVAREDFALTTISVYNDKVFTKPTDAGASGFTEFDLATLNKLSALQIGDRKWSRAHVVYGPFADFLAAWNTGANGAEPPHLTIVRFKRTGTYALSIGALVVTTAPNLDAVLPLLDRLS
jgi:hypothetical protein